MIEVKDYDPTTGDSTLGTVYFPLCATPIRALRQWFPLGRTPGAKTECEGEVYMEIGVRNPRPISDTVRQQFDAFCIKQGYQLEVLVDSDVAESVRAVSPTLHGFATPITDDFPHLEEDEFEAHPPPQGHAGGSKVSTLEL